MLVFSENFAYILHEWSQIYYTTKRMSLETSFKFILDAIAGFSVKEGASGQHRSEPSLQKF